MTPSHLVLAASIRIAIPDAAVGSNVIISLVVAASSIPTRCIMTACCAISLVPFAGIFRVFAQQGLIQLGGLERILFVFVGGSEVRVCVVVDVNDEIFEPRDDGSEQERAHTEAERHEAMPMTCPSGVSGT